MGKVAFEQVGAYSIIKWTKQELSSFLMNSNLTFIRNKTKRTILNF